VPTTNADRITEALPTEITIVCDMMIKVHYFEEANCLRMALSAPQMCHSASTHEALQRAAGIAQQFGFPRVADWVRTIVGHPASQ